VSVAARTFSALELARELGVDRGTVTGWAADGCPAFKPEGKTRGTSWVFELPPVLVWLLERAEATGRAGHSLSTLSQIERTKAQVDLELAELRLAELRSKLVRVDDVLEVVGADYDSLRKTLRSVPARLGPELWVLVTGGGNETDCTELLEAELDLVLANLSGEKFYGGGGTGSKARRANGAGGNGAAAARPRKRAKRKTTATAKAKPKRVGRSKPTPKR
jgi:phage terminase Nu1 subunit (DNA packaging protein)